MGVSYERRYGATRPQLEVLAKLSAGETVGGSSRGACERRGWIGVAMSDITHYGRLTPEGEKVLAAARARGW